MEEIENRIEKLEDRLFYLDMKDRWEQKDYELYDKLNLELKELKSEIKK